MDEEEAGGAAAAEDGVSSAGVDAMVGNQRRVRRSGSDANDGYPARRGWYSRIWMRI